MNKLMEQSLENAARAKAAVMVYPHYSDETRNALLDAIEDGQNVQIQAHKNASEILERILTKCK